MPEETEWAQYVRIIAGRDPNTVIAGKAGVDPATVGRWRSGQVDPKPRQVVALARAYGESPGFALVKAGYLDPDDLARPQAPWKFALTEFSTAELLEEALRRTREQIDA